MGTSAFRAFDPADPDRNGFIGHFYGSVIVSMDGKAGGMTAGARQSMKRNRIYNRIIKGLRNLVEIFNENGYHSVVNRHR